MCTSDGVVTSLVLQNTRDRFTIAIHFLSLSLFHSVKSLCVILFLPYTHTLVLEVRKSFVPLRTTRSYVSVKWKEYHWLKTFKSSKRAKTCTYKVRSMLKSNSSLRHLSLTNVQKRRFFDYESWTKDEQ